MSELTQDDILAGVRACMQGVLKLTEEQTASIDIGTTPDQLTNWTSMAHLELVLAVEQRFGLMFEAEEIAELASVKAITAAVASRQAS